MMKIKMSILALALLSVNSEADAATWVPYDGEVPENVARVTADQTDAPICTVPRPRMVRVGWLNEDGICITAGTGTKSRKDSVDIRLLVVDSPDDEIFEWIPYEGEVPTDAVYNEIDGKAVCRAPGSGRLPFRVGWFADEKGHCITVGKGKKSQKQAEEISMLVARTLPDNKAWQAISAAMVLLSKGKALDNLSAAMEEMFSTCDLDVTECIRDCAKYPKGNRARARDNLEKVRKNIETGKGGVRQLLGQVYKHDGASGATWGQAGIAGDLGFFISNFGMTSKTTTGREYCELVDTKHADACGRISNEEKLAYFETFRDRLTDVCTAVGGTWSDYTSGNGYFTDLGSYGDWTLGQCK